MCEARRAACPAPSSALLSLPCCRHQVARRGLHTREAHHLRGRGRPPRLRQAALPSDQNTLRPHTTVTAAWDVLRVERQYICGILAET